MSSDEYLRTQSDPVGPDTQQRFRAQAGVAARYAVGCVADEPLYTEVLVETVDDVVLRKVGGKRTAVQVKTKDAGVISEKSDAVASALRGFVRHHKNDADAFDEFILETNQPLARPKGEDLHLGELLEESRQRALTGPEKKRLTDLLRAAIGSQRLPPGLFNGVFGKMSVRVTAPSLSAVVKPVEDQLRTTVGAYADARWRVVEAAAKALVAAMHEASANAHREATDAPHQDPHATIADEQHADLEARRFSKERIQAILVDTSDFLLTDPTTPDEVKDLQDGEHRLRAKMEAGGITARTIQHVADSHEDVQRLLIRWRESFGPEKAREYYGHARHVVAGAATAAEAAAMVEATDGHPYGLAMYLDLYNRLGNQPDHPGMHQASQHETLLAIAGLLTRECKVWWSDTSAVEGLP